MEFRNKKIMIFGGVVAGLVLVVSVAFAALASNLNISFGDVTQNALSWKVGFKEKFVDGEERYTSPSGWWEEDENSNAEFECPRANVTFSSVTVGNMNLSLPGQACLYTLTISNAGDMPAQLSGITGTSPDGTSCTKTDQSTMVCGNITYRLIDPLDEELDYSEDYMNSLNTGLTINPNEYHSIQLFVKYTGDGSNMTSTGITQSGAKFTLNYIQSNTRVDEPDEDGDVYPPYSVSSTKCKRATTLHTETCDRTDGGCIAKGYANGATITYGRLGTAGADPVAGDAFTCDLNNDGTYDEATERFYYVSTDYGTSDESNNVTLVYYANTAGGSISNSSTDLFAYGNENANYDGPTIAVNELPQRGRTGWRLSSSTITTLLPNELGTYNGGRPTKFYYKRYGISAGNFLSYKEVNAACGITIGSSTDGELNNCEFLLERTSFNSATPQGADYWLENPTSFDNNTAWYIKGDTRNVAYDLVTNKHGVRPVITTSINNISY